MNLIRVNETMIINMDNVTKVRRWSEDALTVYFAVPQGNRELMFETEHAIEGSDARTLWERLCAAERAGARVLA